MIQSGYTSSFNWNQFGLGQKRTAVKSFALLQVADMQGKVAEKYVYDPAGNILSKTIDGKTTTFTYDKANQLVSSTCDGKVTKYQYDAAGRLIQEGNKSYSYGWLDKVLAVRENGKKIASFDYQVDGQIAQAIHGGKAENFLWDDLALVHRGETSFINEPYVTGGNPILSSKQGVMFNDLLGNTLGTKQEKFNPVQMTAFGETKDTDALFTGKPYIGELGYAFLFRNYRADKGKWLSADPLGYPDGWNNFAYVNNEVVTTIDWLGGARVIIASLFDALNHYAYGMGEEAIIASSVILQSTSTTGYASQISAVKEKLLARSKTEKTGYLAHNDSFTWDQGDVIGRNTMFFYTIFQWTASDWTKEGDKYVRTLTGTGNITLFTEDDWDFTLHNSDSTWETLWREVGPSLASNLYSYFMAGSHGQDYHMIGSAVIHNYSFSVKQYE